MEAIAKSFVLVLLLSLVSKGFCACTLNNINIGTARSGREIGGKPEWNVVVTNNCACAQTSIVLSCRGFQTAEPVDPAILKKQGDVCLLIMGNLLDAGASVKFSYAWDPPFLLLPSSSVISGGC
ncbi:unnamed protein product [Prunus armeniaca]|uniref:Uncharacterized protein n=1 Tax=Prunus armeniaca TaxID=36596 RepID=A0A6J5WAA1_PRUAR|nr:hypothetical protein GBA52_000225 [Prunus armeniaca]CAB4297353.1 unnamed protein product [Prunus armeniaca]